MLVVRADGFVDPCIPSRAPKPPSGPDWVHEVKHDGYRLIVRRERRNGAPVHPPQLRLDRDPRILIRTSSLLKSTTY
jgi:hypothetical protein